MSNTSVAFFLAPDSESVVLEQPYWQDYRSESSPEQTDSERLFF